MEMNHLGSECWGYGVAPETYVLSIAIRIVYSALGARGLVRPLHIIRADLMYDSASTSIR